MSVKVGVRGEDERERKEWRARTDSVYEGTKAASEAIESRLFSLRGIRVNHTTPSLIHTRSNISKVA